MEMQSVRGENASEERKRRYQALTLQTFLDSVHQASKWRAAWVLPFNLGVIALLHFRGAPPTRCLIQLGIMIFSATMLFVRARQPLAARIFTAVSFVSYFATLANTGGLASPLLVTCIPMVLGIVMNPAFEGWRRFYFRLILVGFIAVAALSHTKVGELFVPLSPIGPWQSTEYVVLSFASVLFTIAAVKKMSFHITKVYERVALDLADRREELWCENEDRTRSMEGIAARLAHEVKNPLAAIRGMSAHLCGQATDDKTRERLAIVQNEAERLQQIVDGFLSFSRGLEDLKIEKTRPHEVAKEIAALLEMSAAEAGITLEVKGNPELTLNADRRKLRQALLNFVLNAIQASPAGSTVKIEIAKSSDGAAHIEVQDHGSGMSPEVMERIKRPYFSTKKGGAGLGVAIARGLVEQHGGTLRYESAAGKGTRVHLDLPACAMKAAKAQKLPNPARDDIPKEGVVQTGS
jgi:signal transduction histidine kinase